MSTYTATTWICDRCSHEEVRSSDVRLAEQPMPLGWRVVKILNTDTRQTEIDVEVCGACAEEIGAIVRSFRVREHDSISSRAR